MPERMPVTVSYRPDLLDPILASMELLQAVLLMRFVNWMAINASALPCDLQACCEIVKARSNEARRVVSELTGLSVTRYGNALQEMLDSGNALPTGNALQGLAFAGSPEHGLTLRADRAWGIDPLTAVELKDKARQQIRDRVRKHRAKAGNALHASDGNPLPRACAALEEIPIPNTALSLPSVESVPRAHVHEGDDVDALEAGRLRGAKLAVLRRTGLTGCNGGDPRFVALCAAGVTDDELTWAAGKAVAKGAGFPYAVEALVRARQDVAATPIASTVPGTPAGPERLSAWEARARELAGPSAIGYKPPS